ncbi:MAG: hypothetical protein ABIR79_03620 [Candidatus Binatia bacterium]
MLAVARALVATNGWRNVEIVEASADDAPVAPARWTACSASTPTTSCNRPRLSTPGSARCAPAAASSRRASSWRPASAARSSIRSRGRCPSPPSPTATASIELEEHLWGSA